MLARIDDALAASGRAASVLFVDDGSTLAEGKETLAGTRAAVRDVSVLKLTRNLGHQRAIAVGATYAHSRDPSRALVIMDGDGEDDPRDVPRLLDEFERLGGETCVFAERLRRSEGLAFRFFYALYRHLYRLATGERIRVGNFSIVPASVLRRLVTVSELWNHYAAAVFHARCPVAMLPTARQPRVAGETKMNFVKLVVHGMSAIAVYSDVIGARLVVGALGLSLATVVGGGAFLAWRLASDLALPGWVGLAAGIALIVLVQLATMGLLFSFIALTGRNGPLFLPARDCPLFIDTLEPILPAPCPSSGTSAPS